MDSTEHEQARIGLRKLGALVAAVIAVLALFAVMALDSREAAHSFTPAGVPFLLASTAAASLAGAARARAAVRNAATAWIQMAFVTVVFAILLMPWVYMFEWSGGAMPFGLYFFLPAAFLFAALSWAGVAALVGAGVWTVAVRWFARDEVSGVEIERARSAENHDVGWAVACVVVSILWAAGGWAFISSLVSGIGY